MALATISILCGLTGCAALNDTGMSVLSTKVLAHAVVDEQLLQGEMVLFPDHTGTVALRFEPSATGDAPQFQSAGRPIGKPVLTNCAGRLRYTASTSGVVDLRCNNGAVADLRMALIGDTRGYGYGHTATGLASLVFGMTATEALAHLTVPPNRQLVERSDSLTLELK